MIELSIEDLNSIYEAIIIELLSKGSLIFKLA